MQKKIIALAVAAFASGAAFAQSSVTFGGIVDLGYTYSGDHTTDGVKAKSAIDDGGQDASRLWWKATEDLGNGLSVSAKQEIRPAADRRASVAIDSSVLSLSSKTWGEVRAGNFGNVHDDINGFSETGMGWGNGVIGLLTSDTNYNAVGYVSPVFNGLQFKLNISTNDVNANEENGNGDVNIRSYGTNVVYTNGGLKLGASYDRKSLNGERLTEWLLSGGYNFGMFQIGAGYDRAKNTGMGTLANAFRYAYYNEASGTPVGYVNDYKKTAWRINGGVSITPNDQISLSYSRITLKSEGDKEKASGVGVSYTHTMSKRTNVYASYGQLSQHEDSDMLYSGYQKMFKVGLRHQF